MFISGKRHEFKNICLVCINRLKNITGECAPTGSNNYTCGIYSCSTTLSTCTPYSFNRGMYVNEDDIVNCKEYFLDETLIKVLNEKV